MDNWGICLKWLDNKSLKVVWWFLVESVDLSPRPPKLVLDCDWLGAKEETCDWLVVCWEPLNSPMISLQRIWVKILMVSVCCINLVEVWYILFVLKFLLRFVVLIAMGSSVGCHIN